MVTPIGEASEAFIFLFNGLAHLSPYCLLGALFVADGLSVTTLLSSTLFMIFYVVGILAASFTGVANAILLAANARYGIESPYTTSIFAFALIRICLQAMVSVTPLRKSLTRRMRTLGVEHPVYWLVPVISSWTVGLMGLSLACHIVEFILVALVPTKVGIVDYLPTYLYIPGLAVHIGLLAAFASYLNGDTGGK